MDFLPRIIKKKKFSGKQFFEKFTDLMSRVNEWLVEHNDAILINVETVTWSDKNVKNIYSHDTSFIKESINSDLTGIRVWFLNPVFPIIGSGERKKTLHCFTYPNTHTTNLAQIFSLANQALSVTPDDFKDHGVAEGTQTNQNSTKGRIISIETIDTQQHDCFLNTEETFQYSVPGAHRYVFQALRVFLLEDGNSTVNERIEYQDFIPIKSGCNKENKGYELFTEVADRAARWVVRKGGVRFINPQVVNVKLKNDIPAVDRVRYKDKNSCLLQILRTYYLVPTNLCNQPAETRLSVRTFMPRKVSMSDKFEDMRLLMERVNKWLQLTKATVKSVQTLVVACRSKLSHEATIFYARSPQDLVGRYTFQVRLYLDGIYQENPATTELLS